jgi:hypothetical protein
MLGAIQLHLPAALPLLQGNKTSNLSIVYTPASNLRKNGEMATGQVRPCCGFCWPPSAPGCVLNAVQPGCRSLGRCYLRQPGRCQAPASHVPATGSSWDARRA